MTTGNPPPRYQINLPGSYRLATGAPQAERQSTTTLNISEGGCALVTRERHEKVNTHLQIQLFIPIANVPVELEGDVVWSCPPARVPDGLFMVPGSIGVSYTSAVLPQPYQRYLACCAESRRQIDVGRAALEKTAVDQWAASAADPLPRRFDLALRLAADLITAFTPDVACDILAEAIDLALESKDSVAEDDLKAAIDLYGKLVAIRKTSGDTAARKAQLESLRSRIRKWRRRPS